MTTTSCLQPAYETEVIYPEQYFQKRSDPHITPEPLFKELLQIEYKRSVRMDQRICIILISFDERFPCDTTENLPKITGILQDSTRQTDIIGWYLTDRVIGILYTDFIGKRTNFFVERLRHKFSSNAFGGALDILRINGFLFPDYLNSKPLSKESTADQLFDEITSPLKKKQHSLLMKRTIDVVFALVGLVVFSPLIAVVASLIKLTSPGPVLFKQERIGFRGRKFIMYKFRSMKTGNDYSRHREFVTNFINGKNVGEKQGEKKIMKMVNDPRITTIGKFIRRTSLDELPQLINILIGTMSFVGPRPPISYEVDEYQSWHKRRIYEAKPGLTGIWQIYGRSITDFSNMVRMDINYIKKQSLILDLLLIFKTPLSLLLTNGAV